ncbi:hypothetical protein BDI4_1720017 [Burkholderia diffusa]|nr:hypothetical protein BDI4_1720017 [Burkholderia diffusa]
MGTDCYNDDFELAYFRLQSQSLFCSLCYRFVLVNRKTSQYISRNFRIKSYSFPNSRLRIQRQPFKYVSTHPPFHCNIAPRHPIVAFRQTIQNSHGNCIVKGHAPRKLRVFLQDRKPNIIRRFPLSF